MKKHARTDEEDTVEKQVEGLAEKVIAEDEAKRAQELVSPWVLVVLHGGRPVVETSGEVVFGEDEPEGRCET